jgi:hypothetical protein
VTCVFPFTEILQNALNDLLDCVKECVRQVDDGMAEDMNWCILLASSFLPDCLGAPLISLQGKYCYLCTCVSAKTYAN